MLLGYFPEHNLIGLFYCLVIIGYI